VHFIAPPLQPPAAPSSVSSRRAGWGSGEWRVARGSGRGMGQGPGRGQGPGPAGGRGGPGTTGPRGQLGTGTGLWAGAGAPAHLMILWWRTRHQHEEV
jgi:hypothetical protein